MEILIVDDEPQVAEVLAKSLERQGHRTSVVHSGAEALDRLRTTAPDAMFLDVSMPGMNGLDVMQEVKRLKPALAVVTPGIAIGIERPTYRLAAGYNFTAELFARETSESHAFDRQSFFLDTMWKVDPFLTLSLTDSFIFSTDTNAIARENVSTGRNRSTGNTLGVGASYQLTDIWSLRGGSSYTLERFSGRSLEDSDVYRANVGVDRRISSRLTVGAGFEFGYFDISNEPKTTTYTPRIGATWRATDTITLALSGGPTVERREGGDTRLTPAITASYGQKVWFGSIGLSYDRAVGTAGGLGGPTDDDIVSGYVNITTLMRGLTVQLLPRYSNVQSPNSNQIDIRSFTAALQVTYGLTFGYPIRFD